MRIVLVGGGGHASDVLGAIEALNGTLANMSGSQLKVVGLVADSEIDMRRFAGRGVKQIGTIDDLKHLDVSHFIACVGYSDGRKLVADRAAAFNLIPATVIHPRAWVPNSVTIGPGSVILAGVCISPCVSIGSHVLVSNGALLGHDCSLSNFVSVMPGASISGDTFLGQGCLIGASATVLEKRSIGEWTVIGAGAVVTTDIPARVTAKGMPAKY
jgi:sugar O-acyltransferase (sialic acid O-acetyltransferase NeuD family)